MRRHSGSGANSTSGATASGAQPASTGSGFMGLMGLAASFVTSTLGGGVSSAGEAASKGGSGEVAVRRNTMVSLTGRPVSDASITAPLDASLLPTIPLPPDMSLGCLVKLTRGILL